MAQDFKNTMALRYLSTQIDKLDELGFPKAKSLAVLGLRASQLKSPLKRIDLASVENLYSAAAKALDDPHIGIRVGYSFRIPTYAQTGSMYSYCSNLKQTFELNAKYQRLTIDIGDIAYEQRDENGEIRHVFLLRPYEACAEHHHLLGMIAGAYITVFKWLCWGTGKDLKSVSLTWPKPDDLTLYNEIYQCPVAFSQPELFVEFFPETINEPLITSNPEKLAQNIAVLDALVNSETMSESFVTAVKTSIRAALNIGPVSLPIVAQRLKTTERHLRQQLKTANLSYRDLLDGERKALFEELFESGTSLSAISQELGYNDQSAFNRAFKRWYGINPSQYTSAHKQQA